MSAIVNIEEYRNKDKKRFDIALQKFEVTKKKIQFYLELGADPINLDLEGNTYIDIVNKSWSEHVIKNHKIHKKVKELIYPKNINKGNN